MYPKLLAAFARDELHPDSREKQRESPYENDYQTMVDAETALLNTLSSEQKELFEQLNNANRDLHVRDKTDRFVYGYRLGMLMTMEAFNMRDDLAIDGEAE